MASVGLRARPLRAALSALGIAIGTAAIVGVLGLSSSSQAGLIAEINRLGTNLLTVEAGQSLTGGPAQLPREAPARITLLDNVQLVAHTALMKDDEGLPELDDPGGQHRRPPGAGHQPEPAVRARHRHRTRRLAQRGHCPRAGRGARLGRRATAGHRPGLPRSADLAGRPVVQRRGHPAALAAGARHRRQRPDRLSGRPDVPRLRQHGPRRGRRPARRARSTCAPPPVTRRRCSRCSRRPPTPRRRTR